MLSLTVIIVAAIVVLLVLIMEKRGDLQDMERFYRQKLPPKSASHNYDQNK